MKSTRTRKKLQRKKKPSMRERVVGQTMADKTLRLDALSKCPNKRKLNLEQRSWNETSLPGTKRVSEDCVDHSVTDSCEIDSGICSEASPPTSGRSSPSISLSTAAVVSLDCEMVGTGAGGCCNELARCSILEYHGNILYDKYIKPCQPITDYRTRWSGIQKHHLSSAVPFTEARKEILSILDQKVIVGHALYNDFKVLGMMHPAHMIRDTSAAPLLTKLAGLPRHRPISLKSLSSKLLHRNIQADRRGHCSVEDARAALDLYKLVEAEWEQVMEHDLRDSHELEILNIATSSHYMQDQYWPSDLTSDQGTC
ncbi:interferon-stimulated gene 20 kDa protein [Neosynchiropus ocellatus]